MNRHWAEVSCRIPTSMVDPVAEFLVELSGNGVSIDNLNLDTFSLDTLEEPPEKTVRAYFEPGAALDGQLARLERFLREQAPLFGEPDPDAPVVTIISDEDWATGWRQHFSVARIGRRLVVKPTWEPFSATGGDLVIELDPGMAFGTGTHATTRLCLEALEAVMQPGCDVLDVGTGSGILAIAAAKLGARRVLGTDIDADAIAVARQNCAQNQVSVDLVTTPLAAIPGTFSIVLANILAEDLVSMAADLAARVRTSGALILSGILQEREAYVTAGFFGTGLILATASHDSEWCCLVYRRES